MTDGELLARYAAGGSPEAFSDLVSRHSGMVFSVCRRVLGNAHDAEDAAQAAFLVLMRKAGSLSSGTILAGWLYRTAELCARDALKMRARRARHEREAEKMSPEKEAEVPSAAWEEVSPHLDEALSGLSRHQRDAIVLHYLEGKPREKVAEDLGCAEGTVQSHLHRGLENLRSRLGRRGIPVGAAALAAFLAGRTAEAAPAGLAASISAACLGTAVPTAAALSISAACIQSLFWIQAKVAGAVLAAALAVGVSAPVAVRALLPAAPPPAAPAPAAAGPARVRPIFFLGSDEPEPPGLVARMQTAWTLVERFFDREMRRNGHPRGFVLERGPDGRPRIDVVRGRESAAFYLHRVEFIESELRGLYDRSRCVLAVSTRTGNWGAAPYGAGVQGGFCCTGDPLPWLAETEEGQMALFADRRLVRNAGSPEQRSAPGMSEANPISTNASYALGSMMNGLARSMTPPLSNRPLDVLRVGHFGAANYFTGRKIVWHDPPVLAPETALFLSQSCFFRDDAPAGDPDPPEIRETDIPLVPAGGEVRVRAEVLDAGSGPAFLWAGRIDDDPEAAGFSDLRGRGGPAPADIVLAPKAPLRPGTHRLVVQAWDAALNQKEAAVPFRVVPALPPDAPPPPIDPSETVLLEDAFPAGTTGSEGDWIWSSGCRASGRRAVVHPAEPGKLTHVAFLTAPGTFRAERGDVLTALVRLEPAGTTETIAIRWLVGPGAWSPAAYWGEDRMVDWDGTPVPRVRMGNLPAPGRWVRLEIPAGALGLEGRDLSGVRLSVHGGGDVFWDRIGKARKKG